MDTAAGNDGRVSAAEFGEIALDSLRRMHPDGAFLFDLQRFALISKGGRKIALELVFDEFSRMGPEHHERILARFVASAFPERTFPARLPLDENWRCLLPELRNLPLADRDLIEGGDYPGWQDPRFAMARFCPEMGVGVVVDRGDAVLPVSQVQLDAWGLSLGQAMTVAAENLSRKARPEFKAIASGVYMSQYGDFYDAGRLLTTEHVRGLEVKGDPVAMVPHRASLLVAGANDAPALEAMIAAAHAVLRGGSSRLCCDMFRLTENGWTIWEPPGAASAALSNLQVAVLQSDYQRQQRALECALGRGEDAPSAATYTLASLPDGSLLTYAVVAVGQPTVLPKVNMVFVVKRLGDDGEPLKLRWADFERAAGERLEPLPYVLPTYKVTLA